MAARRTVAAVRSRPSLRNLVVFVLIGLNGLVRFLYVPREIFATEFWSGLVHVRPCTLRLVERFIHFASHALLAGIGVFILAVAFSRESVTRDAAYIVATVTMIALALYPPIEFAALAALGRDVLYPPRVDE